MKKTLIIILFFAPVLLFANNYDSYKKTAYLLAHSGSFINAKVALDSALLIAKRKGDLAGYGGRLADKGRICMMQNNYKEAIPLYIRAIFYNKNYGSKEGLVQKNLNLGICFHALEMIEDSYDSYYEAYMLSNLHGTDQQTFDAMLGLGACYRAMKKHTQSKLIYNRLVKFSSQHPLDAQQYLVFTNLGCLFLETRDLETAKKFFLKSYKYCKKNEIVRPKLIFNIAKTYYKMNLTDSAKYYINILDKIKINDAHLLVSFLDLKSNMDDTKSKKIVNLKNALLIAEKHELWVSVEKIGNQLTSFFDRQDNINLAYKYSLIVSRARQFKHNHNINTIERIRKETRSLKTEILNKQHVIEIAQKKVIILSLTTIVFFSIIILGFVFHYKMKIKNVIINFKNIELQKQLASFKNIASMNKQNIVKLHTSTFSEEENISRLESQIFIDNCINISCETNQFLKTD